MCVYIYIHLNSSCLGAMVCNLNELMAVRYSSLCFETKELNILIFDIDLGTLMRLVSSP